MQKKATGKTRNTNLHGHKWAVTIHGANPDGNCPILGLLKTQFQKDEYGLAAVGYQTGKQGIHPHWQIYFQTVKDSRMKQKMSDMLGEDISFHIQLAKGTRNANLVYVYAVHKQHEIGWIHYAKGHNPPASYRPRKTQNLLWLRNNMKPWQRWITDKVTADAQEREILWVWEPTGNVGKTYLTKYLHYFHGAIVTGGKSDNMKYAIARWQQITGHYPVTIIVDVCRSDKLTKNSYKTLEEIKNAIFFSGKYQSGMVASCNSPNILVFSNTEPNVRAMSSDRWKVFKINPKTHQLDPQNIG